MTKLNEQQKQKVAKFFVVMALGLAAFTAFFSMWQIDVSVGAMNSGGCVFQDTKCIPALVHYEKYLSVLVFAVIFLVSGMLGMIAF
jgi:hypothetical protein